MPVKTTFCLFQRVQDRLYLTPPSLDEHTSSTSAYSGALGFTKPQEKIVLHSIPLKNVFEWLAKPKGPNLVEDPMYHAPEKALVLATTKCMLYMEDPPSVGVGLVYKPHYVSTESFCRAYMHLNVWHAAAADQDSTDKLDSSRFILVSISEASEVMPEALPHPLFLDAIDKEAIEEMGEPLAPHLFRGFRLHTMSSRPPGEEPVHQIAFPRLQGDTTAPMLRHVPEKLPPNLRQGPKVAIPLKSPSIRHWNMDSDLTFGLAVDTHHRWHEAKETGRNPQQELAGVEGSPRHAPILEGVSPAMGSSSQVASPKESASEEERDLEIVRDVVWHLHVVRLQAMHDMGCVREVEQAAVRTLLAEFARLQAILGEDLTRSLSALRLELEASSEAVLADVLDVLNLHSGNPGFSWVKELLQKYHQSVSLKVNLPLVELEAAKVDLNRFLQECLHELGSGSQVQEELGEITRQLLGYNRRVTEIIQETPGVERPGVCTRIMLSLAVEQPMEVVLLPGILDGLSARLDIPAPGVVNQPTSAREGVSRRWAAVLREAVMTTEGREVDSDQITQHVVHPALHQDYTSDFRSRRVADIAPTLTSLILAGITSSMRLPERPTMPDRPETPKVQEHLQGGGEAPVQPAIPGPLYIDEPMETEEEKPLGALPIDLDATILTNLPKDPADVIILDDDEPSFTGGYPEAISTPIIESASDCKWSSEETSPSTSPQKKQATKGTVDPPSLLVSLLKGTTEKDLLPRRHEVFTSDYERVQRVRGRLLGLKANDLPSKSQINRSSRFHLPTVASETEPSEVVMEHWLDSLREDGILVECPPDQFTALDDWIPLYTSVGLQHYLPAALSAFLSQGVPSLIAVAPPDFHVGSDKEFLLSNFHRHGCLMRQSFNIEGKCRQLAFCPYCGVINENSDTALSHVRKHLDLQFVCGGCFSRSFLNGPTLHKHMKTCASVAAIRDRSKL